MLTRGNVKYPLNVPCLIYRQKHFQLTFRLISTSTLKKPRQMYSDTWIADDF